MQLTMEPLGEILEHARVMDEAGFDTVWLAEAYPWWRKHSMEARSSTALSPLVAQETERLAVGWGIISPYTRHPVQIAMEARVTQEAAGADRFYLGLGVSKIFMRHAGLGDGARPVGAIKDAVRICRGVLGGGDFEYAGGTFSATVPGLRDDAEAPRWQVPIYVAATGPQMLAAAGQVADGLLTASITTPAFVRYARDVMSEAAEAAGRDPAAIDVGCTIVASVDDDRERGRDGAREIAGMYLANKVQNIQAAADTLLELAGLSQDEIRPIAEAMERGGRLAAKEAVSDDILDKCRPIAGTPADCIDAIEEYREAGCTHVMLELWGDDRAGQLRLFGERVLPRFR
jgi:5,10-methylenetetrahydromethanopterin reductase